MLSHVCLIGTLITTLDISANEEDKAYYQSLNYEERLFRIQSIHELLSESRAIFEAIIQYRQNKSAEREPEWMEEMQEYIQGHYQDCNMKRDQSGTGIWHQCTTRKPQL